MFRIGLLGLGTMGKRHTEAAARVPGVEIVTREHPAYAAIPKTAGPAAYQTAVAHAMIADPTIDALDLCLPTGLHAPLTLAALAANKHVLCEKPMALNYHDCLGMLQAQKQSRAILMVAHVLRFWPAYEVLREAVEHSRYGPVVSATLTRRSGLPTWAPWLLRAEESGGGILDMLVHDFDQSLLLFGEPATVTGHSEGSPHALDCTLSYPAGLNARITGGWELGEDVAFAMGYSIETTQGHLRFANDALHWEKSGAPPEPIALEQKDPYAAQLAYFVNCCQKGEPPALCTPQSSALAVALSCAVRDLVMQGAEDAAVSLPAPFI